MEARMVLYTPQNFFSIISLDSDQLHITMITLSTLPPSSPIPTPSVELMLSDQFS